MANPPPASLAHIPVDTSKTEPIAAFYKLQFGDELTGFAYYMRTLVVTIGRNVVPHTNTPPPAITTPNVPSIPPLDDEINASGTPSLSNLSIHGAAPNSKPDLDNVKQESNFGDDGSVDVKMEDDRQPFSSLSGKQPPPTASVMASDGAKRSPGLSSEPVVTVCPPPTDEPAVEDVYSNEQALEALAAFVSPPPSAEQPQIDLQTPSLSPNHAIHTPDAPTNVNRLQSSNIPASPVPVSASPSAESHHPLTRDILDGPPPPPPPKSKPPAEPVDVDLGALKSVSRFHAKIEYCADRSQFCLEIHGRNGAWVDGRFFVKGCRVPLEQGSQIQIATRIFSFVLPPSTDGTPNASPILPQDDYSYPHHLHYHHTGYQDFFGDAGPSTIAARIPPRFNAFANGDGVGLGVDSPEGGDYGYGWNSEDDQDDNDDSDESESWDSDEDELESQPRRRPHKNRSGASTSVSHGKGKQKLRQALFDDDSDLSSLSSVGDDDDEPGGDDMEEDHDEGDQRAMSSAESSYSERIPTSHKRRDRKTHQPTRKGPTGDLSTLGQSSDDGDKSDVPLVVLSNGRKAIHDKQPKSKKKTEATAKVSHKAGASGKGANGQVAKKTISPERHKTKEAAAKTAQTASKTKSKKGKSSQPSQSKSARGAPDPLADDATPEETPAPQHSGKRPKGGKWAAKSVTPALLSDQDSASVKKEDAPPADSSLFVPAASSTPKKEKKDKKKKDKPATAKVADATLQGQVGHNIAPPETALSAPASAPAQEESLPPTLAAAVAIQSAAAGSLENQAVKAKKKLQPAGPPEILRRPSGTASADGTIVGGAVKAEAQSSQAAAPPLTLAAVAASAPAQTQASSVNGKSISAFSAFPPAPVHPPAPVEKPKPPPPPPFQHLTELIETPGRPGHIIVNVPIPPSGAGPRPPPAPIVGLDGKPFIGPDPQKPTLTFATIIHRALLHLPRGRGTLGEVCNWVAGEWEYFRLNPEAGWQNSIRHNLSLNKAFLKVARIPSDDPESKGSVWIIDPEEGPLFEEKQRRDAEKSEGKMKNAEVKAERERQRAEQKAKKAKDKDYIGKDGLPLKPGDPKLRMMAPAGSLPRPNLVRPAGTGPNGLAHNPVLAKGKITVVVQPVTPALRARSSLLSKDANGDLLPFVLDGATLILDQQTFLHLNRDIIEKLEHLGAAGAIEVLSAWVLNRNRQAAAKAAAAAAAANRVPPAGQGTGAAGVGGSQTAKVGSAPLAPRPLGQQTLGAKTGPVAPRPAGTAPPAPRVGPSSANAARPLPGPAQPGETLIKVIGMIAEVAAVRGDVNIVGPNASALLTYIKAVGIEIDMPTAERVWATGVVPPLTGRPPASRPGPIGRMSTPGAAPPRQTIGGSSGVVPSANRPPAPLGKFGPGGRPLSAGPKTAVGGVPRPLPSVSAARPAGSVTPIARPMQSVGGTNVNTNSPKPLVGGLPAPPAASAGSVSSGVGLPPPPPAVANVNPLKRKADVPVVTDPSLSDYSSLIGVGSMPMDDDAGFAGAGDAKKARV